MFAALTVWLSIVFLAEDGQCKPKGITSVGISNNGTAQIAVGQSHQLKLLIYDNCNQQVRSCRVSWSSSDSKIASVSNGTVVGRAPGVVTITAICEGKKGYVGMKVKS